MQFAVEQAGDVTVIEFKGRLDTNSAKPFGDKLTELLNSGRSRLIIDFKHIAYISSAGFRALLIAGRVADETNGKLALCSLTSEVRRLFEIGEFADLFAIYASRDEGLAKLG